MPRCASFKTNYKHLTYKQLTDRMAIEINQPKMAPKNGTFHRFLIFYQNIGKCFESGSIGPKSFFLLLYGTAIGRSDLIWPNCADWAVLWSLWPIWLRVGQLFLFKIMHNKAFVSTSLKMFEIALKIHSSLKGEMDQFVNFRFKTFLVSHLFRKSD